MGSCVSRASGDEDGNVDNATGTRHTRLNQSATAQKPAIRPTAPLRPPTPLPTSPKHLVQHQPPWSRPVLDRERAAHFETQAELHPELQENWYAVQLACERLRKGLLKEAESQLERVGLSCPSGKFTSGRSKIDGVKGGLFDERGREYGVPAWCVVDPFDLIEDEPPQTQTAATDEEENTWEGDKVEVRIRPAAGDERLIVVKMESGRPTNHLRELVASKLGVKLVRLTYRGRVLDGGDKFESVGYKQGDIINAQILD